MVVILLIAAALLDSCLNVSTEKLVVAIFSGLTELLSLPIAHQAVCRCRHQYSLRRYCWQDVVISDVDIDSKFTIESFVLCQVQMLAISWRPNYGKSYGSGMTSKMEQYLQLPLVNNVRDACINIERCKED
jgi:hypothetical protein